MLVKEEVHCMISTKVFLWTSAVTVWINSLPLIYYPSVLILLTPKQKDI